MFGLFFGLIFKSRLQEKRWRNRSIPHDLSLYPVTPPPLLPRPSTLIPDLIFKSEEHHWSTIADWCCTVTNSRCSINVGNEDFYVWYFFSLKNEYTMNSRASELQRQMETSRPIFWLLTIPASLSVLRLIHLSLIYRKIVSRWLVALPSNSSIRL